MIHFPRMTSLEKVANVSVILASASLIVFAFYDRLASHPAPGTPTKAGVEFRKRFLGKAFPLPSSLDGRAEATVLPFVSNNCHYCADSMPFYHRLANVRSGTGAFRMVAAVPNSQTREENIAKFRANQILLDGLDTVNFTSYGVPGTPTVALLDSSKVVRFVWMGRLDVNGERDFLNKLKTLCPRCTAGEHSGTLPETNQ